MLAPRATPLDSRVFEIVATEALADAQVTWLVKSRIVLSEYMPAAVNCFVTPCRNARVRRTHRDRLQHGWSDQERRGAGDTRERGTDRSRACGQRLRPAPGVPVVFEIVATELAADAHAT